MKQRVPRFRIRFGKAQRRTEPVPRAARPLVLVLDDNPTMRLMIKVLLEIAAGVRVLEAATDDQALIVASQFELDLLISNLNCPHIMDGLEFLRIFRATHAQVPVVVVSDSLDPVTRMWAFRFGASACVNKLLATSKLVEAVRQVLAFEKARVMPAKLSRHDVAWRLTVERCNRGRWRPLGRLDGC